MYIPLICPISCPLLLLLEINHENYQQYGAQNEVYNDDWVKSGLIVLYFS